MLNPYLSATDLLCHMLWDFGLVSREVARDRVRRVSKRALIDTLTQFLLSLLPLRSRAVLIIDEAQRLSPQVRKQIRMLSNLGTDAEKLLQIVLVGRPYPDTTLRAPNLGQRAQRLSTTYELQPLTVDEVAAYVTHRLMVAGSGSSVVFRPQALEAIHRLSQGVPRLVNLLCDRALRAGFAVRTRLIDADVVDAASGSLELPGTARSVSNIVAARALRVEHRPTSAVRPRLALIAASLALAIGWPVHSRWTAAAQIEQLQLRNATLEVDNLRYRSATTELSGRIAALQIVIGDLRDRSLVDPHMRRVMERLAERDGANGAASLRAVAVSSPTQTLDLLHDLLNILDVQLAVASGGVGRQQALAAATPINLPTEGRVSARFGYRSDPFTGQRVFHPGIDISTGFGQPVVATADGTVASAARRGTYGNLLEIDHNFGRVSRYGHLSKFATGAGNQVERGQVIGYAGDTGRATGSHVHYEVWVGGRAMNPLQLGSVARSQSAD